MEVGTSVLLGVVVVVNTKCLRAAATGGASIQQLAGRNVMGNDVVTESAVDRTPAMYRSYSIDCSPQKIYAQYTYT